jgi:hypothetical protein
MKIIIYFKFFRGKKTNKSEVTSNILQIISRAWLQVIADQIWPAGRQFDHTGLAYMTKHIVKVDLRTSKAKQCEYDDGVPRR